MTALVKHALRGSRRWGAVGPACVALAVLFSPAIAGQVPVVPPDQKPSLDAPCPAGRQLNIVAHQDDDLHFIEPFSIRAARAAKCVRTIYLTSGWEGGRDYKEREGYVRSAYARMAEKPDSWTDRAEVYDEKTVQLYTLVENPKVSVVFLRLTPNPDGPRGYSAAPSLMNLWDSGGSLKTKDREEVYQRDSITQVLRLLMNAYGPAEIHTLNPDTVPFAEHPDHIYTARIAREAALDLSFDTNVYYHQTYPTSPASANVGSADALLKTEITATYYAGSNECGDGHEGLCLFDANNLGARWTPRSKYTIKPARNPIGGGGPQPARIALFNLGTGTCPDPTGPGSNAEVPMGNCLSGPWTMTRGAVPSIGGFISPAENGANRCLQRSGSGDGVIMQSCDESDRQKWTPCDFGRMYVPGSTSCLSVRDGKLVTADCVYACYTSEGAPDNIIPDVSRWAFQNSYEVTDNNTRLPIVGDFDKDGRADVLIQHRRGDGPGVNFLVATSTGDRFNEMAMWHQSPAIFEKTASSSTCTDGTGKFCFDVERPIAGRFRPDSPDDLMVAHRAGTAVRFWLLKSTRSGFESPTPWSTLSSGFGYDLARFQAADVNKDGLDDIVMMHERGTGGFNLWVIPTVSSTGTPTSGGLPVLWAEVPNIAFDTAHFVVGDVDRDGDADVVVTQPVKAGGVSLSLLKSNGNSFSAPSPAGTLGAFTDTLMRTMLGDMDGDGFADVIVTHRHGTDAGFNVWWARNNQRGTFGSPSLLLNLSTLSYLRMVPAVGRFTGGTSVDLLIASRTADKGLWTDWRAGNTMLSVLRSQPGGIGPPADWLDLGDKFGFSNMLWLFRIPKL